MKCLPYKLLVLCLLISSMYTAVQAQEQMDYDISFQVNTVYPPLAITRDQLNEAQSLVDLNQYYKPDWVKKYISVEIVTIHQGQKKSVRTKNDQLSSTQLENLKDADFGSPISVQVVYIPENDLIQNETKHFDFTFTIDPDKGAIFQDGSMTLLKKLVSKKIRTLTNERVRQHHLAAVKFTVNEEGKVVDAHIFSTSEDDELDKLLLQTVCDMPDWNPARYGDGSPVEQDFMLTAGDHYSCVLNTLGIRKILGE